jgi:hypothetical protein
MRDIERKQATIMKDMEEILSSYVLEMKEENEQFLEKVKKGGAVKVISKPPARIQEKKIKDSKSTSSINTVEPQLTDDDLAVLLPKYEKEIMDDRTEDREENQVIEEKPHTPLSIGEQAKQLYESGLSIEEIAKKLNKGKTEIELFIKFNG